MIKSRLTNFRKTIRRLWYRYTYPRAYAALYHNLADRYELLQLDARTRKDADLESQYFEKSQKYREIAYLISPPRTQPPHGNY